LEREVREIAVQDELYRQAGIVRLKHLDSRTVGEKEWPLVVIHHPRVLTSLPSVANKLDEGAVLGKGKLREHVKAAAPHDSVVLNSKFQSSRFLSTFVEDVIEPPIPHFERQKIGGHTHTWLGQGGQRRKKQKESKLQK